eukprot:410461_1
MVRLKRAAKAKAREKIRLLFKTRKRTNCSPKRRASKKRKIPKSRSRAVARKSSPPVKGAQPRAKSPEGRLVFDLTQSGENDSEGRNAEKWSMIVNAMSRGDLASVKRILGDSPNCEHIHGALNMAVKDCRLEVFRCVAHLCDTPVSDVVSQYHINWSYGNGIDVPTARTFIVEFGIKPEFGVFRELIRKAFMPPQIEMVRMIIQTGIFYTNQKGDTSFGWDWTALHLAAFFGRIEIFRMLMQQPQLNIFVRNQDSETAHELVTYRINEASVRLEYPNLHRTLVIIEHELCEAERPFAFSGLRNYLHPTFPMELIGEIVEFL